MTVVARVVQLFSGAENPVRIFLLGRGSHLGGGGAHCRGNQAPVLAFLRPAFHLQQLGRFDERRGIARHARPLAIVPRPRLPHRGAKRAQARADDRETHEGGAAGPRTVRAARFR